MGVIRVILAILVGIFVIVGIDESFKAEGREQVQIMIFTVGLIIFEAWLIGG